jgi:uracil-DNA glycosylase family 4
VTSAGARKKHDPFDALARRIVACTRCPRLRAHCEEIARAKRRAYRDETYWGLPVPSFGDPDPYLLVVGLAPGAHGANRTGRVFTGDSSGEWLYRELHDAGFASGASSRGPGDGLVLSGARITCAVRCAPPGNRPRPDEIAACRPYLVEELARLRRIAVILALGRIAFDAVLRAGEESGRITFEAKPKFAHGGESVTRDGRLVLLASYHPSRQNTQTGRLTRTMFRAPFRRAREILHAHRRNLR